MNHQEKQEIFDRFAKSQGFKDWEDIQTEYHIALMSDDELKLYIFAACDLVQEEQQKRISERISNSEFQKGYPVDISSIINPENLIS
ncbi:hypothetical protein V2E39_22785 [Chryseobacterium arthrosphaerae]|uniref:Uncharacterized protein n=1 Tax=Chryseobacterium arthrosphaerae TaxID=651561 RepID=A0ABU7R615_9FLAO